MLFQAFVTSNTPKVWFNANQVQDFSKPTNLVLNNCEKEKKEKEKKRVITSI